LQSAFSYYLFAFVFLITSFLFSFLPTKADSSSDYLKNLNTPYSERIRLTCLEIQWSIERSICKSSLKDRSTIANKKLREIFGESKCSCVLTIVPDGSIKRIRTYEGSGSSALDKKAIQIIEQAAPFKKNKLLQPFKCVIYLPMNHTRSYKSITSKIQGT